MSITVEEKFGRRLSASSAELVYFIKGTEDAGDARDEMLSVAPSTHEGLVRNSAASEVDEIPGYPGGGYTGRVQYVGVDPPGGGGGVRLDVGQTEFRFTTVGGTTNRKHALDRVAGYSIYGGDVTGMFPGLVAVDDNGVPQGVDIPVGSFDFEITKIYTMAQMNNAKIIAIQAASGKVNSDQVTISSTYPNISLTLEAGELLFRGANGGPRGTEEYQVTFSFSAESNLIGQSVGDIDGIDKDGWDALWTKQITYETDSSMSVKPTHVFIERVIERVATSGLI